MASSRPLPRLTRRMMRSIQSSLFPPYQRGLYKAQSFPPIRGKVARKGRRMGWDYTHKINTSNVLLQHSLLLVHPLMVDLRSLQELLQIVSHQRFFNYFFCNGFGIGEACLRMEWKYNSFSSFFGVGAGHNVLGC